MRYVARRDSIDIETDSIDAESLALIERLQQEEERAEEEKLWKSLDLANQLIEMDEELARSCRRKTWTNPPEHEDLSLAYALQLQEELESESKPKEDEQVNEESLSLAYAIQLQEEIQHDSKPPPEITKQQVLDSLESSCESQAIKYVTRKAKKLHQEALPKLQQRVEELGFPESALTNCLEYIRDDAPIVIHLKEETLAKLVEDTHYRSLFETKTSGGNKRMSVRKRWEKTLFGSWYSGCQDFQRPKYGCLNISGDIRGVRPARGYGRLFITLANHVRHRCTFSDQDTGTDPSCTLATNEYYAHVLYEYPDVDLKAALTVSRIGGARSQCQKYKETQVHGPICLATDILSLSIPGRYQEASEELKNVVEMFQQKTKCTILWQGDLLS